MLRITGYSDKYQAFPGEEIKFYVNAEKNENYDVQIIRLIHGDTNPEGPGYKDEEIGAECNKTFQGRNQRIHGGSYIIIPQDDRLNTTSFTLQLIFFQQHQKKVNKEFLLNGMIKLKVVLVFS